MQSTFFIAIMASLMMQVTFAEVMSSDICGDEMVSFGENVNGVDCVFCAKPENCEVNCVGTPLCQCGMEGGMEGEVVWSKVSSECCDQSPCCDNCPEENKPKSCFVSSCGSSPPECSVTICPMSEPEPEPKPEPKPVKISSDICGDEMVSFGENVNGVDCVFCHKPENCEVYCKGTSVCQCSGMEGEDDWSECCDQSPCCDNCPEEKKPKSCFVSSCESSPPECSVTICPMSEPEPEPEPVKISSEICGDEMVSFGENVNGVDCVFCHKPENCEVYCVGTPLCQCDMEFGMEGEVVWSKVS
eukprot:scaffold11263_cov48-Attheya_sp.AAC.1